MTASRLPGRQRSRPRPTGVPTAAVTPATSSPTTTVPLVHVTWDRYAPHHDRCARVRRPEGMPLSLSPGRGPAGDVDGSALTAGGAAAPSSGKPNTYATIMTSVLTGRFASCGSGTALVRRVETVDPGIGSVVGRVGRLCRATALATSPASPALGRSWQGPRRAPPTRPAASSVTSAVQATCLAIRSSTPAESSRSRPMQSPTCPSQRACVRCRAILPVANHRAWKVRRSTSREPRSRRERAGSPVMQDLPATQRPRSTSSGAPSPDAATARWWSTRPSGLAGTTLTQTSEIVPGFARALATARGSGTATASHNADGTYVGDGEGHITCQ